MSENKVAAAYRKYAENYDLAVKFYRLLGLKIGKYRKMTVNALELSKGDTVVELGCGTGLNFPLVLDIIGPEGKLIGVDITDKMLDQARKRAVENGWNNVELVQSDFAEYPFPNSLDGIYETGALQYSTPKNNFKIDFLSNKSYHRSTIVSLENLRTKRGDCLFTLCR